MAGGKGHTTRQERARGAMGTEYQAQVHGWHDTVMQGSSEPWWCMGHITGSSCMVVQWGDPTGEEHTTAQGQVLGRSAWVGTDEAT